MSKGIGLSRWALLVVAAVILAFGAVFTVQQISAHSAGPGSDVIHSCVNNASGAIKITDSSDECKGNSDPLDWTSQYPVSVAMDGAQSAQAIVSSILVNGRQITGPVAPGASVQVAFSWSISPPGFCPGCISQVTVGFAGESDNRCVFSGTGTSSGTNTVTLTAPTTVGPAVFAVRRDLQFNCTPGHQNATNPGHGDHQHSPPAGTGAYPLPANPGFGTYMAVVAVK